jgi:hypothetical protein
MPPGDTPRFVDRPRGTSNLLDASAQDGRIECEGTARAGRVQLHLPVQIGPKRAEPGSRIAKRKRWSQQVVQQPFRRSWDRLTNAEDEIRFVRVDRFDEAIDVPGIVLALGIERDDDVAKTRPLLVRRNHHGDAVPIHGMSSSARV